MEQRKKRGSGGANWMDTYGDMVTLLLCFFVMLYSLSTVDKNKWEALVASINPPEGIEEIQPEDVEKALTQAEVDENMEEIYDRLHQFVAEQGLEDRVSLTKGSGYVFISFDDTVFFDGDSYVLRQEGEAILDQVAGALVGAEDSINEIRVLGHTAQAAPERPNNVDVDRFLASNRATVVTVCLQEKNILDPSRLVSVGYGQWRPIAANDSSAGRAKNRRVELIISGLKVGSPTWDSVTRYYTMQDGGGADVTAPM